MRASLRIIDAGAVGNVTLEGTGNTSLPSVNVVAQLQRGYKFHNLVYFHSVTQNARNQLCVVPIFRIEYVRQTFESSYVTVLVLVLEVVSCRSILQRNLDNVAMGD